MTDNELCREYVKMCKKNQDCVDCDYYEKYICQLQFGYDKGRSDCLEEFVKNVLYELNGIAEDESYYFDKDNANLVSSVMYSHLEQLKENDR